MRNNQSHKPATGKRITYINVVKGTKIIPRMGQMIELNTKFHFAGATSHQSMIKARGIKRIRMVSAQHIANLLGDDIDPC
jgi:hypothetical protein